jgi:hypothetical protein
MDFRKISYLYIVIVLFAVIAYGSIELVKDSKPIGTIVLPQGISLPSKMDEVLLQPGRSIDSPSVVSQGGAVELQKYIEQASGAKLPIVNEDKLTETENKAPKIYVGPCNKTSGVIDVSKLQPEGFVILTKEGDIFIVGHDVTDSGIVVTGTLYGVYEFLERFLGVRWLMPTTLGEVVPKTASVQVDDVNIKQQPLLWQRNIRDCHTHIEYGRMENTIKGWGGSVEGWQKFFARDITGPWFIRNRIGSRVKLEYGHAYNGWWDKYHVQYPDYFAMQSDGTRDNTNVREQFCTSNPGLWDLIAKEKIKELKGNPRQTAVSISPNDDGDNKFCMCGKCAAMDPPGSPKLYEGAKREPGIPLSDRHFKFYNEIAKRVGKEVPDRYLGAYAYWPYKELPVTVKELEKNLLIGFVGFDTYLNEESRQKDRALWLGWGKLAKQLFIRPNLFWYNMGVPVNYAQKYADDIRFMADNGMRAADFDGLIGNWGSEGLEYYVAAKLLWNPYADVNAIIDDYCKAAYGAGASAMKTYYDRLQQITNQIAKDGKYTNLKVNAEELFGPYNDDVLKELQSYLDKATTAIGTSDSAAVRRVKLAADALDYTRQTRQLVMAAYNVRSGQGSKEDFEKIKAQVDKYYASHLNQWSVATAHNYTYISNTLSLSP